MVQLGVVQKPAAYTAMSSGQRAGESPNRQPQHAHEFDVGHPSQFHRHMDHEKNHVNQTPLWVTLDENPNAINDTSFLVALDQDA